MLILDNFLFVKPVTMQLMKGELIMKLFTVYDEKSLKQAILAQIIDIRVTSDAVDICNEAERASKDKTTIKASDHPERTFIANTFKRITKTKAKKRYNELLKNITDQYMIIELPSSNELELLRGSLV